MTIPQFLLILVACVLIGVVFPAWLLRREDDETCVVCDGIPLNLTDDDDPLCGAHSRERSE